MYKATRTRHKRYSNQRSGPKNRERNNRIDVLKFISGQMETEPLKTYEHVNKFEDFDIGGNLAKIISANRYYEPTEIQDKAIPHILSGSDLIGIAGTGTGKTAAFLIPIIQRLIESRQKDYALIIAPTRELASQILEEFRNLTRGLELFATALIGGSDINRSIKVLRRTNHIIVATPGRLIDMVERRHVRLDRFKVLVLDEFDRMLDMGFVDDVQRIHHQMTGIIQTLLFSATMDNKQKQIIAGFTESPVRITASSGKQLTHAIEQDVLYVPSDRRKSEVLNELLNGYRHQKVLLFCDTKRIANKVFKNLQGDRIQSDMIHGDKTQRAREVALRKFRKGQIQVLVATDVVARGIDVHDVSLVINYEVPRDYTNYVHRIGRTGRAGKTGKAITFID